MKIVDIWTFSCSCFPAFGLNVERYRVFKLHVGKYGPESKTEEISPNTVALNTNT